MGNRWSERIDNHAVMGLVDALVNDIRAVPTLNPNVTPDALSYLHRAERVIAYFRARMRGTDSALLSPNMLDRATPRLQNAQIQVQAFASDNNEEHMQFLDLEMDGLLNEIPAFAPLPFKNEAQVAKEAAELYSDRLTDMEAQIRSRVATLDAEIDRLSGEFSQQAQAAEERFAVVTTAADESAARVTGETDSKVAEVAARIDPQVQRLDAAISQMQATFSEAQERRVAEFGESQTKHETEFGESQTKRETEFASHLKEFDSIVADAEGRSEAIISALEQKERRAAQILGITAASEVTKVYRTEADEQRKEANTWRLVALGAAGVLAIYLIVIAVFFHPSGDLSASEWLAYGAVKLPFGLVIASVLPYLFRQSTEHRQRERTARRMAMELTTFRPFLSELDEGECKKAIMETYPRFFRGQPSEEAPTTAD